ncbi:calcium-binding EGF-like domain-containing protein pawn isoform 2-T5 [Glossina fuscipes fuscipes]
MRRKAGKNSKFLKPNFQTSKFLQRKREQHTLWCWRSIAMEYLTITLLLLLLINFTECVQDISQISPKSNSHIHESLANPLISRSKVKLETTMRDFSTRHAPEPQASLDNDTREHTRVMRSAQPILNDNYPKIGPNNVNFPGESEKEAAAGRYFQYNIKPTGTLEMEKNSFEPTQKVRSGKTLKSSSLDARTTTGSFLVNGDLRQITSGSLINPTTSIATSTVATATAIAHNARQNPSPDIQDIITGIVKLLNGNVNVHANTQGIRRPTASRINNRGPPRISDVQTMPLEYDGHKPSGGVTSIRPPPYPFDRPDRPFITGVPIPEQIVPYRPNFVSNRPPWHRNKPRPPISTTSVGGRRPIPQYKPLPSPQMQPPQEEEHISRLPATPSSPMNEDIPNEEEDAEQSADNLLPTDTTFDSEFSNEDLNTQYIEVSDNDGEAEFSNKPADEINEEIQSPSSPPKKEEMTAKKKPNKHKIQDKKKQTIVAETTQSEIHSSSTYTHLAVPVDEDINIDHLTEEEVIFMTSSKTPELQSALIEPTTSASQPSITSATVSTISTEPLLVNDYDSADFSGITNLTYLQSEITPTTVTPIPPPSTTATTTSYSRITTITTSTTISTTTEAIPQSSNVHPTTPTLPTQYQSRPGIVLDDPEFLPGGRPRPKRPLQQPKPSSRPPISHVNIQPTRQHLPPGYGEIFDVTLSAIQGPGSKGGSQQTINIKPYGSYGGSDVIVSASGEQNFVSIDGKRTYINFFGDPTGVPIGTQTSPATATMIPSQTSTTPNKTPSDSISSSSSSSTGSGGNNELENLETPTSGPNYGVAETEIVDFQVTQAHSFKPKQAVSTSTTAVSSSRPHYRPRTTQPPVRIDTCIVGDDSTCDQAQHEYCKTENGVSSCHCRPGYSRRKHREPCRRVITFYISMRIDRIYEHRIVWDNKLADRNSDPYGQLSYESIRAIDSAMSMTPYSDEFMEARVNNIYRSEPSLGGSGVFVNLTIKLDESVETLRPNLRSDVQKHLLGVLHRRNNNIGNSVLYVTTPEGAISALRDLNECQSQHLNDCHPSATCSNSWGSFRCLCPPGTRDPWADQPYRAGRECQSCPDTYCNSHGTCGYSNEGNQICVCDSSHYGGQCEIDGEVLGVAIGASVAAVVIIVLTLVCLIMWSRRWQREQKNAIGSPIFGYMSAAPLKSSALPQPGYQVTLEDRMRWAQIADVMAQSNHYAAEPIGGPTRPSSAMFAYPNLQALAISNTIGGLSMQSSMQQMHQTGPMAGAPPVPLPRRLGLSSRSNGMRALENSSSSEEEDRTDLLGRNFQVPRPKSRSNGSITNQSGIYYDVDYEPSGNGIGSTSVDRLYGSQNQSTTHSHVSSNHIPGPQGIPMSTYTSGRAPTSYYMK